MLAAWVLTSSCGARSGLYLDPDATAGTAAGGRGSGVSGGGAGNAGGGRGGAFVDVAGSAGAGATGGRAPGCALEPGRCRLLSDVECEGSNPLCQGALQGYAILPAEQLWVSALGASRTDDRIAVAGMFTGTYGFGSEHPTVRDQNAPFVNVLDDNAQPAWVRKLDGSRSEGATGVAFTTEGAVVVQGRAEQTEGEEEPRSFAASYSPGGDLSWRRAFDGGFTGKVAAGPKGDAWLAGTFADRLGSAKRR